MPRFIRILGAMAVILAGLGVAIQAADLQITTRTHSYVYCTDTQDSASISVSGLAAPISGFRLALGIEETQLSLLQVKPGAFMTGCQWEYLSWRLSHPSSIAQLPFGGSHVTAILEINGFASLSAGHVATCYNSAGPMELVNLNFILATSDHRNQCAFLPLRFYWRDCRDNVFYSMTGDTLYAASQVREGSPVPTPLNASFPGFGAPGSLCDSSVTKHFDPSLAAINGGFDLACTGAEICNGDLNLNGHSFEVADLTVYLNYLTKGLVAFGPNPAQVIPQADIDGDGQLTVTDFAEMLAIVLNGARPSNSPH